MSVRVTQADVEAIMEANDLTAAQYTAFITGANALVNQALGTGTTDILKEIERWLTAHMIASAIARMARMEGAGGAQIEYVGKYGEGLHSTPYGQMVLALDTTGAMASLMGRSAKITAITSFD